MKKEDNYMRKKIEEQEKRISALEKKFEERMGDKAIDSYVKKFLDTVQGFAEQSLRKFL